MYFLKKMIFPTKSFLKNDFKMLMFSVRSQNFIMADKNFENFKSQCFMNHNVDSIKFSRKLPRA